MSLAIIVGHQGAGKKSVLQAVSDRLKKSTTIVCKPLDQTGEPSNFEKTKDSVLRDLRKGLKVLVVQPIERLMTVLPLFLTAHEVKIFNLESDLDTVIERLKNSDGENKLNDKEAAALKKSLKKAESDNSKHLASAQTALDEAKGWSKEAEESKESAPESAGEKVLREPRQGGRNVILTLKNDGPLVATVEQLLQGIEFNPEVDLPPKTPEELRAEHLQSCTPQEYLQLTVYPELLPALQQLDSYRPDDAVEWLALELYRKATETQKQRKELAKLQDVEARIRKEVAADYSVVGRI